MVIRHAVEGAQANVFSIHCLPHTVRWGERARATLVFRAVHQYKAEKLARGSKGSWEDDGGVAHLLSAVGNSSCDWDTNASITYRRTHTEAHMHNGPNEVQ